MKAPDKCQYCGAKRRNGGLFRDSPHHDYVEFKCGSKLDDEHAESHLCTGNQRDQLLARVKRLEEFVRDCRDNWDCDEDGHTHGTGCRACAAKALLCSQSKEAKP